MKCSNKVEIDKANGWTGETRADITDSTRADDDSSAAGASSQRNTPAPMSPRRLRSFKLKRARRAALYMAGAVEPTPSVSVLIAELNAEDEKRNGPREVARWCVCPGCGSPFIAFRLSGTLMPNVERLRAGVGSERWAAAPVCSPACYNLTELLGPFDEALTSAHEAVNGLLGMTISRVIAQMRRSRIHVVSRRTRVNGINIGVVHTLTDEQIAVLNARVRQLSALIVLTRQYGVKKFRGRKPGSKNKPKTEPSGP